MQCLLLFNAFNNGTKQNIYIYRERERDPHLVTAVFNFINWPDGTESFLRTHSRSADQEFLHLLWNLKVNYCVHNSLPLDPTLSRVNLVHTLTLYSFKIYFNIILSYAPRSPKSLLGVRRKFGMHLSFNNNSSNYNNIRKQYQKSIQHILYKKKKQLY